MDTKYWNHEYEKIIGIMDAEKLVSWIHKNWSHGYGKFGIIDTKKMISWTRKIGIMHTVKLVS